MSPETGFQSDGELVSLRVEEKPRVQSPATSPIRAPPYLSFSATWIPFIYSVWLGSIKIDYSNNGVKHHVFKTVFHPQSQNTTADIALLKLTSRVTFTSFILPICLPNITKQLTIPGSCWVTGWGQVKENEGINYTSTLQEVEIPVIDRQTCEYLYNPLSVVAPELETIIKEDMICAGDINKKDSCKGDSGGPLSCHIDGVWTQIGLVSWGLGCAKSLPGVYTNVIYYQKWIKATISRAETNMQIDRTFASPPAKPRPPTNQDEYANYPNKDGG
ncbi:hypothetical protein QTO34_015925 [Cnephaeus nilssonii]|uniref:Peptidase S1 domain-containing protein n=1 Tax=Cnephaeus nilssonii TaxID=3371016 RepID=A0AA40I507_CNENI|nr:hypothetical protein QTO34_015925 [Eptesicus nilssonii]